MTFVPEAGMFRFTENELPELPEAGVGFVVPICAPVELSFNIRSVTVAASCAESVTLMVFTFTPSVEPVESTNEPRRALLEPAIIV